jgi:uncharacterized membrane protein YqgA involved in biofilm formation
VIGTLINVVAILVGGGIGIFFGARLPEQLKTTVISGMGLFVCAIGIQMFLKTENALVVLGALLIGAILGEWWRIEAGIEALGGWLERKFTRGDGGASSHFAPYGDFVRGFLSASLIFCTGPMAILGAISDGLRGDYLTLSIKSVLDGFIAIAFSSTLGVGVLFATIPVFLYQGSISLLAQQLSGIMSEPMINEMTATGGVLLMGLSISSLLELKKIRIGNFLPALVVAPLIVYILGLFGK